MCGGITGCCNPNSNETLGSSSTLGKSISEVKPWISISNSSGSAFPSENATVEVSVNIWEKAVRERASDCTFSRLSGGIAHSRLVPCRGGRPAHWFPPASAYSRCSMLPVAVTTLGVVEAAEG